jgi:hypothetical protein
MVLQKKILLFYFKALIIKIILKDRHMDIFLLTFIWFQKLLCKSKEGYPLITIKLYLYEQGVALFSKTKYYQYKCYLKVN